MPNLGVCITFIVLFALATSMDTVSSSRLPSLNTPASNTRHTEHLLPHEMASPNGLPRWAQRGCWVVSPPLVQPCASREESVHYAVSTVHNIPDMSADSPQAVGDHHGTLPVGRRFVHLLRASFRTAWVTLRQAPAEVVYVLCGL